jgi:hypothetical protein
MKVHDVVNGLHADGILPRELVLRYARSMPPPDFAHILPGERRQPMVLPPIALMITNAVLAYVPSSRTPAQVAQRGVKLAARAVTCFFSLRTPTDESFENKMVHELSGSTMLQVQVHLGVAVFADVRHEKLPAAHSSACLPRQGTRVTEIADLVETFPIEDGLPEFAHPGTLSQRGEH